MKKIITSLLVTITSLGLTLSSANATECKGKSASACSTDNSCSWVKSYKRKDGAMVNAYCRVAKSTLKKKIKSSTEPVESKF